MMAKMIFAVVSDANQLEFNQDKDLQERGGDKVRDLRRVHVANWPRRQRPKAPLQMISWRRPKSRRTSRNQDCDMSEMNQITTRCIRNLSSSSSSCDQGRQRAAATLPTGLAMVWPIFFLLTAILIKSSYQQQQSIIIDNSHHLHLKNLANQQVAVKHNHFANNNSDYLQPPQPPVVTARLGQHFQPASLLLAQNKSINFTHVAVDELTGTIYLGATNWLLQVSSKDLRVEQALRTGPTSGDSSLARDCSPSDCMLQLSQVDLNELMPRLLAHEHNVNDLSGHHQSQWSLQGRRTFTGATLHNMNNASSPAYALLQHRRPTSTAAPTITNATIGQSGLPAISPAGSSQQQQQQQQQQHNNYNKILVIDYESRHLIVCGSLNQGACRRHQLGNLSNFSELIPLPVASDDEHSSTVALIVGNNIQPNQQQATNNKVISSANLSKEPPILYVAATNSRLGPPNREMVPAISARSLDWSSRDRAMQIIERSFTDLARVDISFGLRDYYLVNYVHAFQHNNFVYFATVQRKSALLQLEEWGYVTRLVRLCLNDLSFQSYAEMTLECSTTPTSTGQKSINPTASANQQSHQAARINYNLLQDAHLMQAGSQLQHQLGLTGGKSSPMSSGGGAVLVGAFSQSRDHTTKSSHRSAICLFPMEKIEQKFQENIDLCYNGTIKSRNMDYIAGGVNDCPKQQGPPRQQNYCNEPVKLNGSLALVVEPIQSSETELITSITSTLAPTSPINLQWLNLQPTSKQLQTNSIRQHQVLIAGTSEGQLKRFVVVASNSRVSALEFDSVSLATPDSNPSNIEQANGHQPIVQQPVLADLHLVPANNPQLFNGNLQDSNRHQFVVAATAQKLVKLRVNSCRATRQRGHSSRQQQSTAAQANNSSIVDDCLICSQLQDPFCGWCSSLASCTTRDECLSQSVELQQQQQQQHAAVSNGNNNEQPTPTSIHWTPFDSIRCSNYQPISPKNVPIQADSSSSSNLMMVDVNVRLNLRNQVVGANHQQLAARLSQAQFVCHFDYLSLWNRSTIQSASPRIGPTGATTKATQARLNLHAGTAAIGCPLPVVGQRPILGANLLQQSDQQDHARVKLSVRLSSTGRAQQEAHGQDDRWLLEQVLGMRSLKTATANQHSAEQQQQLQNHLPGADSIERELTFYDCSLNLDCRSCLSSGSQGRRWSCAWCPLSQKCTFNASHPDFGCAASAVASTTPHSANLPGFESSGLSQIRGSQLTVSLDRAQTSVLGMAIDRLERCPKMLDSVDSDSISTNVGPTSSLESLSTSDTNGAVHHNGRPTITSADIGTPQTPFTSSNKQPINSSPVLARNEILVPNNVRRSVQLTLTRPVHHYQPRDKRVLKLECLVELEGAKARFSARLLDNTNVICQESLYSYQAEISTQIARLSVVLNDNQVIETTEVIIYKCHLFGVNPPAIASSVIAAAAAAAADSTELSGNNHNHRNHHSSASWSSDLNELFNLIPSSALLSNGGQVGSRRESDCSLCLNIDRKYQCSWCSNQCRHSEQCQELPASTCPPPRIDSIHPTSGPLEGGTLLTIEGSNLGSNEREIQDKILVGREQCQLVMYSVSTRIVCKTGPSLVGPQAATVFVNNRAGVTSAHEKFEYKAIHLADVNPRIGPVSGGTRLLLTGSNLNIGSRVQIFLDEIQCQLDSQYLVTSNQIACITGPNLFASSSMRIKQLVLQVDNSTHRLPFPFTYQPDPIITSIEPAESFLSGGRLILINGQHLDSPQSIKLQLYLEHRPNVANSTACQRLNDTLITCLTPAFARPDLLEAIESVTSNQDELEGNASQQDQAAGLSYESGGVKLKMSLLMDDVRSVRNLDEYYHHLPHHITYFEDPKLFRVSPSGAPIEYRDELIIAGQQLRMKQLDQDMQISIGIHICRIKSIEPDRLIVEPPARIAPVYESHEQSRRRVLVDRPLLPIVALIGANLKFDLGLMQYSSSQYLAMAPPQDDTSTSLSGNFPEMPSDPMSVFGIFPSQFYPTGNGREPQAAAAGEQQAGVSIGFVALVGLSSLGLMVALAAGLMFAMARFRQTKAKQREYKRIQLQMGSLDMNNNNAHCRPAGGSGSNLFASGIFDKIHYPRTAGAIDPNKGQLFANQQQTMHRPVIMDYAVGKAKPLYQFLVGQNLQQQQQQGAPPLPNSFPPSPLTDISSLIGSSPGHPNLQQQHVVKLNANGQIVSSTAANVAANSNHLYSGLYAPGGSSSSTGSSSGSSPLRPSVSHLNQQQRNSARNFNWTQEAPSTIVPYAVIEACNLTLEGKNAIKEFV